MYHEPDLQPIPAWIWHPQREKRRDVLLEKRFSLSQTVEDVTFRLACTGAAEVRLNGREAGALPDDAGNAYAFAALDAFPARLEPGDYVLTLRIRCEAPMPIHPINIHLADRSVGCIAYLEGTDFWMCTDASWQCGDASAEVVCLLGEEPYGELEGGPDWFVAGGYGDLAAAPIASFDLIDLDRMQAAHTEDGVRLRGTGAGRIELKPAKARGERHLFYHLLKQNEWTEWRARQRAGAFDGSPRCLLRLAKEYNARLRVTNRGAAPVTLVWNGAESTEELADYEACITEGLSVPAGETAVTNPQGMRYVQLFVGADPAEPFDLDVRLESVGVPLTQVGEFETDHSLLNSIYETSVHTSLICHQIGLWDGIKRDRLNWALDVYMAGKTDYSIWGELDVLRRSFRELGKTPYGYWMNALPSYTLWWLCGIWDYYWHTGDGGFVLTLKEDIQKHTRWVKANTDPATGELCPELRSGPTFIEWSPIGDEESWVALNAIYKLMLRQLGQLQKYVPELELQLDPEGPSLDPALFTAASTSLPTRLLGIMAGIVTREEALEALRGVTVQDPITPISAYWLAECCSEHGLHDKAWEAISKVWGTMLSTGATVFWESTVLDWGDDDYHRAQTTYTNYGSYRMSLCHSWSSTPAIWMSKYVLGIRPLSPGYAEFAFEPNPIPGVAYCKGAVPSPRGPIRAEWRLTQGELTKRVRIGPETDESETAAARERAE